MSAALVAALFLLAPTASAGPPNDDFANAESLHLRKQVRGSLNGATKQPGEPRHAKSLATHSVWYRLRVNRRMTVAVNTCNTNTDTVIAVYTGSSLRGLKTVQYNNDACVGGGSRTTFQPRRGVTYRIAVAGFAKKGTFRIGVFMLSVPRNDYFADAIEVSVGEGASGNTVNATRELGEPRHELGEPHTVWYKLSVPTAMLVEVTARNIGAVTTYTGKSLRSLKRVTPTASVQWGEQFQAQPGVTYHIVLESSGVGTGYRLSTREVTPTP